MFSIPYLENFGSFASGGDFVAIKKGILRVSKAGPERVTITPLSEIWLSALGISLETSYASKQMIEEAVRESKRDIRVR
jgi:hypothetical protein